MRPISGLVVLGLLSVLILAGCAQQGTQGPGPSPGAASGTGRAVFTIADKAADMGNITSVKLTVDSVQIHSTAAGWLTLSSAQQTFDLLQLKASDAQALLAQANLSNGTYEQVRLHVSKVVVTDSSGDHEAKLPSGDLKITGGFTVKGNTTSVATFDFAADRSLHVTGNGQYIMAPVIHLQTRENASVDAGDGSNVRVSGGSVRDDVTVGMDENGTVGEGREIPDADVSIDDSGRVRVGVPAMANVSSNGRVVVGVKDKTANMSSVSSVEVTIDSVSVHSSSGGWVTLSSTPKTFDLIGLDANGSEQLLADSNVSNGTYQQIRLEISSVVVTDANGTHTAKLPSGELRLVGPLLVGGNSTSTMTFDFLANESLHVTGNGQYIMAPVLRLETRHDANVSLGAGGELKSKTGHVDVDDKQGMDENGTVRIGGGIPPDIDVSIGADGHVSIVHGPTPGKPLINVTANASVINSMG